MLTTAVSSRVPHVATPMSLEPTGTSLKVVCTPSDVNYLVQSINGSAVGQVVPRTGGAFAILTYFVSPAQKAIALSRVSKQPTYLLSKSPDLAETGMLGGFCATVGLRATADGSQHSLPLVSLVNLIKDADGYKYAKFAPLFKILYSILI